MTAKVFTVGRAAHDAERYALAYLVQRLPESFTVYTNSWVAERDGGVFELDAVVVAPHAVFVVEIKGYRGAIRGTDHDWLLPDPRPSPLRLNRLTAQILKSEVRRRSAAAGRAWVEGFVFLSHTTDVALSGTASRARVHTRETILAALQDADFMRQYLTRGQLPEAVDDHARNVYHNLLSGVDPSRAPVRRVREWTLTSVLARGEDYIEYSAHHDMTEHDRVLRVYPVPWSATDEERRRIEQRCTWEAQVLVNVGEHQGIVSAEMPFREEIGVCLPLERFAGISLSSWLERHLAPGQPWPSLAERLRLWKRVAVALHFAHTRGVVHRLLRPEVILVTDEAEGADVRLTGFEMAKQVDRGMTAASTTLDDARVVWAAPEIVRDFHEAEPRSDQFSLGALLGLLATGQDLFPSTAELLRRGVQPPHLHDLNPRLPKALDAIAQRMLALRPADRFESVTEAGRAVEDVFKRGRAAAAPPSPPTSAAGLADGQRLGPDYEVVQQIGSGGLATVYKVRHLMSGQFRAFKVARPSQEAEDALRAEYEVLSALDHPAIARAFDLSAVVPDHLTMVLAWVEGEPLPRWLDAHPNPDAGTLRRFSEDLLDALAYLEARALFHKDIKPDNLLLGPRGLTLIDFSLVGHAPEAITVGTPLYRDPALGAWDAAADRYAAALCLFELYVGAHAFDGNVPPPDALVALDDDEVTPATMAAFLRTALAPDRAARHGSLAQMRDALRQALGQRPGEAPAPAIDPATLSPEPGAALDEAHLSLGTLRALRRGGVRTQGQLVAARPETLMRIRGIGRQRLLEVEALRQALLQRGVPADHAPIAPSPMSPAHQDDTRPVSALPLSEKLVATLARFGYDTVGQLAMASEAELLGLPWLGPVRAQRIRQVLDRLDAAQGAGDPAGEGDGTGASDAPLSLEAAWERAATDLTDAQRKVLRLMCGYEGAAPTQTAVAETLGVSRQAVHLHLHAALQRLDRTPLAAARTALQEALDGADGILPLDDAVMAVVAALPTEEAELALRVIRVLVMTSETDEVLVEGLTGQRQGLVAQPNWDGPVIAGFLREAFELATWPPKAADGVRRSLELELPGFEGDALALAARIGDGLALTPAGELFIAPVAVDQAIPYLLQGEQLPVTLAQLGERAQEVFGSAVAWPAASDVAGIVERLDLGDVVLDGDRLVTKAPASVATAPPEEDALPEMLVVADRRPEQVAGDLLRSAAAHSHWRLVVTPPARHRELGRNVARALGPEAVFVSFEERLLERLEPDFEAYERAERFKAMKPMLTEAAEALMEELLAEHGRPGAAVVLGDTAVLQVCGALHLVNRIYDATLSGERGFWAMVVPGIIYDRTPLFNERDPLPWIEGAVLPLRDAIPVAA